MYPLDVSCRSAGVVVVVVVAGGRLHSLMLDITTATRAERQRHCCCYCVHGHCMCPRHHEHQEQRFVVLFASRLSFTPCVSSFPTFIGALLRFVVFGRMGLSISVCLSEVSRVGCAEVSRSFARLESAVCVYILSMGQQHTRRNAKKNKPKTIDQDTHKSRKEHDQPTKTIDVDKDSHRNCAAALCVPSLHHRHCHRCRNLVSHTLGALRPRIQSIGRIQ